MLSRQLLTTIRRMTHFVNVPSRSLVLGVVGLQPGKLEGPESGQEALELYRHFLKSGISISQVSLGIFEEDLLELQPALQPALQQKKVQTTDKLPSGNNRHLLQLAQQATLDQVPVVAVARHSTHTFVRSSWMLWSHRDERHKILREILSFRKLFTLHAYKYFSKVAPNFAYVMYEEPAKFIVLKSFRYLNALNVNKKTEAVILAVPEYLIPSIMHVIKDERFDTVSEEDLNLLQASGYSYWPLLFLGYVAIPLLSTSLVYNFANKRLKLRERLVSGGYDPSHVEIQGSFGSRWVRDTRRD